MPTRQSEDREDIEKIEAWAEVIKELLWLVPPEQRANVLALATKNEQAEAREREKNGGFCLLSAAELEKDFDKSPSIRHWHTILRLKSLVVQVFVRRITNNHSKEDAAQILFAPHPYGNGSGLLRDYLRGLPRGGRDNQRIV